MHVYLSMTERERVNPKYIYLSIYPSIHPSIHHIHLYLYPHLPMLVKLEIEFSELMPHARLYMYIHTYKYIQIYTNMYVYLSIYLSTPARAS